MIAATMIMCFIAIIGLLNRCLRLGRQNANQRELIESLYDQLHEQRGLYPENLRLTANLTPEQIKRRCAYVNDSLVGGEQPEGLNPPMPRCL